MSSPPTPRAPVEAGAEPESPFEEAVGRALEGLGYRVVRQVGVSGYRVDLAILSEDGSGIDLGIECDGATYHSAPAARDRDWLREEVLNSFEPYLNLAILESDPVDHLRPR